MKIEGLLFDMDGVICDSAKYHYLAWKKLANHLDNTFKKFNPVFEEKKIKRNKIINKKRILLFAQEYQKLISKI